MNKYATNHREAKLHLFRGQMLTAAEIAVALGTGVSSVSKRIKAGSPLDAPVRPMTPRERPDKAIPMPREEVIAGLVARWNDLESHETPETLLIAAYNAGAAIPQGQRADLEG